MSDTATSVLKVLGIVVLGVISIQMVTAVCKCSGLRAVPYVEVVPIAWMRKKLGTPNVTLWGTERGEFGVGGRLPLNRVNIATQGARLPDDRVLIDTKYSRDPQGAELLPGMKQIPAMADGITGPKLCPINDINCSGSSQAAPGPDPVTPPATDSDAAACCAACFQGKKKHQGCGSCAAGMQGALGCGSCGGGGGAGLPPMGVRSRACPVSDPTCSGKKPATASPRILQGQPIKQGVRHMKLGAALSPSADQGRAPVAARNLPKLGSSKQQFITGLDGRGVIDYYETNSLNQFSPEGNVAAARVLKGLSR